MSFLSTASQGSAARDRREQCRAIRRVAVEGELRLARRRRQGLLEQEGGRARGAVDREEAGEEEEEHEEIQLAKDEG